MVDNEKMKLLSDIREKLTAFFPTDDNRLDEDYLWQQAKLARNVFVEKMFQEDKRNISEFFQRIDLTVLDYDADSEPDLPELKRAVIPPLINLQGNIRFLGPKDRSDEYTRTSLDGFFNLSGRDWTADRTFYIWFKDRVFFSSTPEDSEGNPYTTLDAWVLLEDPEDDSDFDVESDSLVPLKYQTLLEDTIVDNVLKYAREGILSRENDATDRETTEGR